MIATHSLAVLNSLLGITIFAIALPVGIVLAFVAVSRWGHTRRFQIASCIAFAIVALWNLGSAGFRFLTGDFGLLLYIELAMAIGFGLQTWWFWNVEL